MKLVGARPAVIKRKKIEIHLASNEMLSQLPLRLAIKCGHFVAVESQPQRSRVHRFPPRRMSILR